MAIFGGLVLTNAGRNLEAKAQLGKTLKLKRIALGDGEMTTESMLTMNQLVHEVLSLDILNKKLLQDNIVQIIFYLTNQNLDQGFVWRELGVIAEDPDTKEEILYCYGNARENGEYIDSKSGQDVVEKYVSVDLIVSNVENVIVSIDESQIYVTEQDFDDRLSKLDIASMKDSLDLLETEVIGKLDKAGGTVEGNVNFKKSIAIKDGLEVSGEKPYIDFHSGSDNEVDYTTRLIETERGKLSFMMNKVGFHCNMRDVSFLDGDLGRSVVRNGSEESSLKNDWNGSNLMVSVDDEVQGYVSLSSTSDRRLKKDIAKIDERVIEAIGEVSLKQFRVTRNKGNKIWFGVIAQELMESFEKRGLDVCDYGLINTIVYEDGVEYFIVDYEQFCVLRMAWLESRMKESGIVYGEE